MFYVNPIKFVGLLLFLSLGIWQQAHAEVPTNYATYDVNFYDLEVKLDAKFARIAGTSVIHFKTLQKIGFIELDLDPFMEVAHVKYKGRRLKYDHREGRLRLLFPRQLGASTQHKVEILFYGSPGLSESIYYTGGIIWQKDAIGKDLIFTRKGSRGTGCWWPHKYDPKDAADSMRFAIIYPRESQVVVPAYLVHTKILPGEFKKWTYEYRQGFYCGSLQFGIGDILRARSTYQGSSGTHDLIAYTIPGQYSLALERLKKVQAILSFMENYFGEYPFWKTGFHLFEPGFLMPNQDMNLYAEDIQGTEGWLFDVVISDWIGRSIMYDREEDAWMMNMFKKYAESLYVSHLNGESAGLQFLEARKGLGSYQRAWILHGLRRTLDDEQLWWDMLGSMLPRFQNRFMRSEDFFVHLVQKLGEKNQYYWQQYLQKNEIPVLELRTKRKGKKLDISYRWATGVNGFELPVDLWIFDEKHRLSPKSEWQVFSGKKVSEKHINVENPLGLFEVKRGKM